MDETNKAEDSVEPAYPRELKLAAVARLQAGEKPTALARELGVRRTVLYKWVEQVVRKGEDQAFRGNPGRPMRDEDELARLRRENQRLQLENEILKKLQAYSARHKR